LSAELSAINSIRWTLTFKGIRGIGETSATLVLTYDNTAIPDGAGAQLQRIYGTYAISRLLGVSYLHSPLAEVGYQGLSAVEANVADPDFHRAFNDLFSLPSDVVLSAEMPALRLPNISLQVANELIARTAGSKATLVRLATPHGIADQFPDCYDVCKQLSPFSAPERGGRPLRVALHVRRGEQVVLKSARLLPNRYFVGVARRIADALDTLGLEYEIELWTEVPTGDFVVGLYHHGINGRLAEPFAARAEMYGLEEFNALPNLVPRLNGRAIDCLEGLATADVLVMSRSSFSYVGAILNRNGAVMYHPFWHSRMSSWIEVGPEGQFDASRLIAAVNRSGSR
jgi:hypothetical protein